MKVTVESCLKKIDNRFKLVLMASKRAKDLERGARATVARDDDKSTIIAMREIAEEAISLDSLENITRSNIVNRNNEMQIEEEDFYNNDEVIDDSDDDMEDDVDADDDSIESEALEVLENTDEMYAEDIEEIYNKDN